MHTQSALAILLAVSGLAAQTLNYAPSGHGTLEGGTNNTIPWWAQSGTYQQIHDASDLTGVFGGPVAVINSINLRKDGFSTTTIAARSMDIEINLGHTAVAASGATATFATNIGATPVNVLPFTPINLPGLTNSSLPNPVGWSFPFATPFTYTAPVGNLCWEMRFRSSSSTSTAPLDAASPSNATTWPLFGTGCIATGQTTAAAIGLRSLVLGTGAYRNRLDRGAANTPAVLFLGGIRQQLNVPGLCSSLETLPIVDLPGGTDGAGMWDLSLTFGSLTGQPSVNLIAQFAFIDVGLGLSVGLSNASEVTTPPLSTRNFARIYAAPSNGGAGNESAVTGSVGLNYGLVTIFGT